MISPHLGSFLHLLSRCSSLQYFGNNAVLFRIPACEIFLPVKWSEFAVLCNIHLNPLDNVKPSHSWFMKQRCFNLFHNHFERTKKVQLAKYHFWNPWNKYRIDKIQRTFPDNAELIESHHFFQILESECHWIALN